MMSIKKLKKLFEDESAQMAGVGTLYAVFFAAIIILAIIIIFTFIPGIGSTVAQSTPTIPAYGKVGGDWNATDSANPNQVALQNAQGSNVWASTSGMLKVVIIVALVVIILGSLFMIFQSRKSGPGGGPM